MTHYKTTEPVRWTLEELKNVDWEIGGRVHNWRRYVGEKTKEIWNTFTDEQRYAIAYDADEQASNEEWD